MHISLTDRPLPFKPVCLGADSQIEFLVKPLTTAEFDALGFELFRFNIAPVTQDSFRATMIDELFEIYGDADGEAKADLLDGFWQSEDIFNQQLAEWQVQDGQRMFDEAHGAAKRNPDPLPTYTMPVRQRARAQLLAEELRIKSRRMRDLTIEMQTYPKRQAEGIARLVICGWTGLKTKFVKDQEIVPLETFEALKAEVGKAAMMELDHFISSLNTVTAAERGNSDSLLDSEFDPTGSPALSDGSASSDGNSTVSTSGPTPPSGSGATTGPSSSAFSAADGASPKTGERQTAGV